ncbi:MAG: hypothetical protein ACYC27_19910 [Armatimonadota bacterium]
MDSRNQNEHRVKQSRYSLTDGIIWFRYIVIAAVSVVLLFSLIMLIVIMIDGNDYGIAGGFFLIALFLFFIIWMVTAAPSIFIIREIRAGSKSILKYVVIHDAFIVIISAIILGCALIRDINADRIMAYINAVLCVPYLVEAAIIIKYRKYKPG